MQKCPVQLRHHCPVAPIYAKDKNGNFIALDLFTFFGTFNRDVKFENRIKVLIHLKDKLKLTSNLPSDFSGIPTMNNQNSWFYWGGNPENEKDITNSTFAHSKS